MSLPLLMMMAAPEAEIISNASLLDLACTAAELADGWTDGDTGEGVSAAETSAPGADPVDTCWSFDTNTSADTNDRASRIKDIGSIDGLGNRVVISIRLYCDLIGLRTETDQLALNFLRSDWLLTLSFCSDGLFIYDGAAHNEVGTNIVVQDTWQTWTFDIDLSGGVESTVCDVYLGDALQASAVDCSRDDPGTDGNVELIQYGYTNDDQLAYIDYVKIGDGFA